MMTIMVASLTIGIAVEDCIHYLYRYGVEFPQFKDGLKTMYHCHANIAKAGFYTTLTVCCGFSILVLSNFVPSIIFGILTTVAMTIAILGALTLMPKLILMWKPFR
jgi:predicted RND superfamily exporter protein